MIQDTRLSNRGDTFSRHTDSVLCCSLDNNIRLAVSGGIDDTAFVWDINTKHVIFECVGHKESVVAAAFSVNSSYVATGDLNGYIQVRNTTTGNRIFEYEIDEINWILWHNSSEFVLLAGTIKGDFWMWNVNDPAAVKTFPSYGYPTTAAKIFNDGMRIVSTYGDGSTRVFDLKTRQTIFHLTDSTQTEIISLDLNYNNTLIAIGFLNSRVKLLNVGAGKIIGELDCKAPANESATTEPANSDMGPECEPDPEHVSSEPLEVIDEYSKNDVDEGRMDDGAEAEGESDDSSDDEAGEPVPASVESVLFSPCGNYLAASTNLGSIFIWEVAAQVIRCELHTGTGITRSCWSDDGKYTTACSDGFLRIYDKNLTKVNEFFLHNDQILDLTYKSGVIVTASEDKTCRVINVL